MSAVPRQLPDWTPIERERLEKLLEETQAELQRLRIERQVVSIELPKEVARAAQEVLSGKCGRVHERAVILAKFVDGIVQ